MRIRLLKLMLCVLLLLLSGCWSRREMNDLGVVVTIGIDRVKADQLEVILTVAQPGAAGSGKSSGGGGQVKPKTVIRRTGRTLIEAIRRTELSIPRRLSFSHNQVVILGEALARENLDPILDFLLRKGELRLSSQIYLLRGASVIELLQMEPLMENLMATALQELVTNRAGLEVELRQFFAARSTPYQAPMMPILRLRPHEGAEPQAPPLEAELAGAAVTENGHVVGTLDSETVRGLIWLAGGARHGVVTAECPDQPGRWLSARVARSGHKLRTYWRGDQIAFKLELSGQLAIVDMQCDFVLDDPKTIGKVQAAFQKRLIERTRQAIDATKAIPADPLFFGERVRAYHPAYWRKVGNRWSKVWADTPVQISADRLTILHIELTNRQPPASKGERSR